MIRSIYWNSRRIQNAIKAFKNEITKPESFLKGEDFEDYLRQKVFTNDRFDLVMKTHDYNENKSDFVEASLFPDFLFRLKDNGSEFFVEAKYREKLFKNKVEWCKPYQFKRYKNLATGHQTLIAIGLGGRPNNPDITYLVPLKEIEYNALYLSFLKKYEVQLEKKSFKDAILGSIYTMS